MRISDWSSDVRSSDLPNGSGPFGFTETNPIPVNGPIGQLAYLSRLETQSGQRILFHRLGAIDKVDVFEAVTFDGSRSEEHTSELQSLMSISYDVFCLKKKRKRQNVISVITNHPICTKSYY